jgi:hypothetical protein
MERLRASIGSQDRLDDPHRRFMIFPHLGERGGILWETGSTEAGTRLQIAGTDAFIEANSPGHVTDAGIDLLAEFSHLVDIGDLGGEKSVCGILDQFGRPSVGQQNAFLLDADAAIELRQVCGGEIALRIDNDAVGLEKILHGATGPQELGI